jgi:hypothetical protein
MSTQTSPILFNVVSSHKLMEYNIGQGNCFIKNLIGWELKKNQNKFIFQKKN